MSNTALPHALGPEKAVLSLMMQDNIWFSQAAQEFGFMNKMFYLDTHLLIASVIEEYTRDNRQVELTGFVQTLINKGYLDLIGGAAAVTEIYSYAPTKSHIKPHIEAVKATYLERELVKLAHENLSSQCQNTDDIRELLANNSKKLNELESMLVRTNDASLRSSIASVLGKFEALVKADDPRSLYGLLTGLIRLDDWTMGLNPADLFVIGARPSMGKTAFLLNLIENIAVSNGKTVQLFSMEMSQDSITQRLIYSRAGFNYRKLLERSQKYIPTKLEFQKIKQSAIDIGKASIVIDDRSALTIQEVRIACQKQQKQGGLHCVAIDYLQLMRSASKCQSKEVEISEISGGLKSIAKDFGIPVIVLSQLSRPSSSGKRTKPKMSDLRYSGAIEQDADIIGLLDRADYENSGERVGEAFLHVSKNRNGITGDIPLIWTAEIQRFAEKFS